MNVQESVERGFYDDKHEFKSNLRMAAGIAGLGEYDESDFDPSLGELKFEYLMSNTGPNGEVKVETIAISSHPCTDEELGIGTESTMGYYPPSESTLQ